MQRHTEYFSGTPQAHARAPRSRTPADDDRHAIHFILSPEQGIDTLYEVAKGPYLPSMRVTGKHETNTVPGETCWKLEQKWFWKEGFRAGNAKGVECRLHNWWQGEKTMAEIKKRFGDKDGRHATISEVSVTQYLFPEAIKQAAEAMGPPSEAKGGWADAEDYRRKFPDGRIGSHPELATPAAGKAIFEIAVAEIAASYKEFSAAE